MKYYAVFRGRIPGVYDNWDDALEQVESFPGALYKGYKTSAEASEAFRKSENAVDSAELRNLLLKASEKRNTEIHIEAMEGYPPEVDLEAWAVDASCLKNPGTMEYRGVELKSGKELFRVGPFEQGTNNIGEFLAIVHAMALMYRNGEYHNIYSDSKTGMSWVKNKCIKTNLKPSDANKKIFELMARGLAWLQTHTFPAKVMKWETEKWGEIPADFGRK